MQAEQVLISRLNIRLSRQAPDLSRSSMIDVVYASVEASYTTEAGREGDLIHGQAGLVNELLRKVQAARVGYRNWRCPQVSQKQAAKMPRANPQAFRKNLHSAVLEATLTDQTQGSRNGV
jgi:hypothetical protein